MHFGRASLTLLTFLAIGTSLSDAQSCAIETAAILSTPSVSAAYDQMDEGIVGEVVTCIETDNDNCVITVDTSGVEEACTSEGGESSTPSVDMSCRDSNTGDASVLQYDYVICVGANCTEADASDIGDAVNDKLGNITDKFNEFFASDGIECSALLVSGAATKMSVAFMMTSIVTTVSYSLF